jgi:hypothetical protein
LIFLSNFLSQVSSLSLHLFWLTSQVSTPYKTTGLISVF